MSREHQFGTVRLDMTDGTAVVAEDVGRRVYDRFVNALYSCLPDETFTVWADGHRRVVRYVSVKDHRYVPEGKAG